MFFFFVDALGPAHYTDRIHPYEAQLQHFSTSLSAYTFGATANIMRCFVFFTLFEAKYRSLSEWFNFKVITDQR